MRLTKQTVERAAYEGVNRSRDVRWDDEIPGFGLRIYPSGRRAFVLSYRCRGRKHLLALGTYPVISADEARRIAKIKLGEVASGSDPLEAKRAFGRSSTLRELCDTYMERHSKVHKKSWREDERRLRLHVLPKLGALPVEAVKVSDVTAVHLGVGASSIYEANRTIELLRGIFEKARAWGILSEGARNPAKAIKRFKEKKRERWLTPEELPRVAEAIAEERNLYVRAAIWLYLLTGVRKSELLSVQWSDVSFERMEIRLRDTKAGNDHHVPLSSGAVEILRALPRLEGNPFVIPGQRHGRPMVNIMKPWRRIRAKAGVEDVRLHDLRRTVGSWLAQSGSSLHLISRVLNHRSSETTKIYARLGQSDVRNALEQHGAKLLVTSQSGAARTAEPEPPGLLGRVLLLEQASV